MFFCTQCVAIILSILKLHMTMEKSVERRLKNLECKFSKALQEVNQGLSTKLSETEARLKVPVIDKRLKNVLRMLISKVLGQ